MFSANATKYSAAVLLGLGISFSIGLPTNAQTPPANGETTAPGPTPGDVKTLFYNKDTFFVPFTANQSFSNGVAASEVLLFVSGDRGASWQLYQRQPPSAKRFAFRAAADGEYWFAVRTNFGAAEPSAEGLDPQLKVVLDTAKPRLELSATFFSATQAARGGESPTRISIQNRCSWNTAAIQTESGSPSSPATCSRFRMDSGASRRGNSWSLHR